jgi:hypothetical protein
VAQLSNHCGNKLVTGFKDDAAWTDGDLGETANSVSDYRLAVQHGFPHYKRICFIPVPATRKQKHVDVLKESLLPLSVNPAIARAQRDREGQPLVARYIASGAV